MCELIVFCLTSVLAGLGQAYSVLVLLTASALLCSGPVSMPYLTTCVRNWDPYKGTGVYLCVCVGTKHVVTRSEDIVVHEVIFFFCQSF